LVSLKQDLRHARVISNLAKSDGAVVRVLDTDASESGLPVKIFDTRLTRSGGFDSAPHSIQQKTPPSLAGFLFSNAQDERDRAVSAAVSAGP
jgi:hypothetical protein